MLNFFTYNIYETIKGKDAIRVCSHWVLRDGLCVCYAKTFLSDVVKKWAEYPLLAMTANVNDQSE